MLDPTMFMHTIEDSKVEQMNENTISSKNSSSLSYLSLINDSSGASNRLSFTEDRRTETHDGPKDKPHSVMGYILKQRRSPMKGFHKRFVYLAEGRFSYSKSKNHLELSTVIKDSVPLWNIEITMRESKIFIDTGSVVHKFKFKSIDVYEKWCFHLKEHKNYSKGSNNKNDSIFKFIKYDPKTIEISDQWTSPGNSNESRSNTELNGSNSTISSDLKELDKLYASMNTIMTSLNSTTITNLTVPRSPSASKFDSNASLEDFSQHSDNDSVNHLAPAKSNKLNLLSRNRSKRSSPNHQSSQDSWKNQAQLFMAASRKFLDTSHALSSASDCQTAKTATALLIDSHVDERINTLNVKLSEMYEKNKNFSQVIRKMKFLISQIDDSDLQDKYDSHAILRYQTINQTLSSSESSNCFYDAKEFGEQSGSEMSVNSDGESCFENDNDKIGDLGGANSTPMIRLNNQATLKEAETKRRRASEASYASRNSLGYRTRLSCKRPSDYDDFNMVNLLYKNIGTDLSKIRLPVFLNEPLSALQRLCEDLEYSQILDEVAIHKDPMFRMALMSAFAVSMYSSSAYRASTKPFNPILGETFECVREEKGWKYMAEQVSHHPPSAVCHCIHNKWTFHQELTLKNKFWGKSLEAIPEGFIQVHFKNLKETYTWSKVSSCIYNIIGALSKRTIENYGTCVIDCPETNVSCKLSFHKRDWSGKNQFMVTGQIQNKSDSSKKLEVHGFSNQAFYVGDKNNPEATLLWVMSPMPENYIDYYGYSQFAVQLNEEPDSIQVEKGDIPITDSRLRPDQRYLEVGQVDLAEEEKARIEDLQRERISKMIQDGQQYLPKWFRPNQSRDSCVKYDFDEDYWMHKKKMNFKNLNINPIW